MRHIFTLLTAALLTTGTATANDGTILQGLVDIPRLSSTAPVDGCAKITKGLINNGGFLVFTCEKLLPYMPISEHAKSFKQYQSVLISQGWTLETQNAKSVKFVKADHYGCRTRLEMNLWTDRSMNELPVRPASDRDAHRQILFKAKFHGDACERYYALAESLALSSG